MELETETPVIESKSARFHYRIGGVSRRAVEVDEVAAFQASQKYVNAYLQDGSVILLDQDTDTIKALALEFPDFMQVNRGILVRRSLVREFKRDISRGHYDVSLESKVFPKVFPVSRRFVPHVRKALKNEPTESVCGDVSANAG
jgi:DNA-binding LytR/AlgR family response regulator